MCMIQCVKMDKTRAVRCVHNELFAHSLKVVMEKDELQGEGSAKFSKFKSKFIGKNPTSEKWYFSIYAHISIEIRKWIKFFLPKVQHRK